MTVDDAIGEIFSCDEPTRLVFRANHEGGILSVVGIWLECMRKMEEWRRPLGNRRIADVEMFLFSAANSLLVSMKLLVSGLLPPSGSLMRTCIESIALALLCAHPALHVFEAIERDKIHYPYHKTARMLVERKSLSKLGLSLEGIKDLKELVGFYHKYSHASYFSVSSFYDCSRDNLPVFGSNYDGSKKEQYATEIANRKYICRALSESIDTCRRIAESTIDRSC